MSDVLWLSQGNLELAPVSPSEPAEPSRQEVSAWTHPLPDSRQSPERFQEQRWREARVAAWTRCRSACLAAQDLPSAEESQGKPMSLQDLSHHPTPYKWRGVWREV